MKSGDYAARIRDEAGCYSPYSEKIVVEAKPNPAKPDIIKTGIYTIVAKNNITAGKYIWKLGSTVLSDTIATLKANQSGSYTVSNSVVYSSVLTCSSPFSDPLSILVNSEDQFVVYPNPTTNGRITLETLQNLSNVNIQVIDQRGNIHRSFSLRTFIYPYSIDLSNLSNGLYLIRFNSNDLNEVQKINLIK